MHPSRVFALPAAALVAVVSATGALAHHPMGGQAPQTWIEGLLSGVGHPILGLDHLAFVLGLGLMLAVHPRWRGLPWAFAALIGPGVLLHAAAIDLGPQELYVAVSVVVLGAALALEPRLPLAALLGFTALAGLLHGYAFGETIVGSGPAPIVAYALGLSATVLVLAFVPGLLLTRIGAPARWRPAGAAAVAGIGLVTVASAVMAA